MRAAPPLLTKKRGFLFRALRTREQVVVSVVTSTFVPGYTNVTVGAISDGRVCLTFRSVFHSATCTFSKPVTTFSKPLPLRS